MLVAELGALALALIAYALAPALALAALGLTVVGAIYIGVLSGLQTVVQLRAPAAYRGRILSLFLVALGVVYPIGALVQGPLADRIGLGLTTTLFALALLGVLAAVAALRPEPLRVLGEDRPGANSAGESGPRPGCGHDALTAGRAMGPDDGQRDGGDGDP